MNVSDSDSSRIFEKLDAIGNDVAVLKSQIPSVGSQLADHESRLRSLEARLWYAIGAVGFIALAAPLVISWVN